MSGGWAAAVLFGALFFVTAVSRLVATRTIARLETTVLKLSNDVASLVLQVALEREKGRALTVPIRGAIDAKTQSLIRLAVSNPEEEEARNAAVSACRRLKKAMDL